MLDCGQFALVPRPLYGPPYERMARLVKTPYWTQLFAKES